MTRFEISLLAALILAMGPAVASGAEPTRVQLRDLIRKAEFESAKISPTGKYLAVEIPLESQTMLGIIDMASRKVTGHLRWGPGEHVQGYWWAGPDRVVASMARAEGPLDQPRATGHVYAINADGGSYSFLSPGELKSTYVIDGLPRDPDWILVYVIPYLRGKFERPLPLVERLNVYNGERSRMAIVPGQFPLDVAADQSGRVRLAFSSDDRSRLHLYVRDGTPTGWSEVRHPKGLPQDVKFHQTLSDGSAVFLTTAEQDGRECLREYRFDTSALVERRCVEAGSVGEPVFGFDDGALIGVAHESRAWDLEFTDAQHADARLLASIRKAFPGQRVEATSHTVDGKKVIVLVDSDRNPGDFYLVDRQTRKAEYLMSRRSWIDPALMAPASPVEYKARDGAVISGYLTASGGTARKAPLVLIPHGGPHGVRDWWRWDPWTQALAARGYAVLQVNFRGSGGFGYAHQSAGYQRWGTLMQDDLTDAVRWAVGQGIADPARICIMGGSYGGYAALMSAAREPDLYRCAIGLAGVYDLPSQSRDSDAADSRWGRNYLSRVLGNLDLMREQSPITHLEKLKVPVLIAHGTADRRVPFSQAEQLRKALDKLGKPYEWAEYKGEGHGFYKEANHEDFLKRSIEFLDKHIGPQAAAPAPGS